jgi:hypothetical protein
MVLLDPLANLDHQEKKVKNYLRKRDFTRKRVKDEEREREYVSERKGERKAKITMNVFNQYFYIFR